MSRNSTQFHGSENQLWTQCDVDPFDCMVLEADRLWVFGMEKIQQLDIETGESISEGPSPGDTWRHDVTFTAEHLVIPVGSRGVCRVRKDPRQDGVCIWPAVGSCDAVVQDGFAYCTRWQQPGAGDRKSGTRSDRPRGEMLRPGEAEPRSGKTVAKLDLSSWKVLWEAGAGSVGCRATVAGGRVYVGSADGGVHVLDDADGKLLWRQANPPGRISSQGEAILKGSLLYLNADIHDKAVYAVRADKPGVAWSCAVDSQPMSYAMHHDGKVFCGTESSLYAIDASQGENAWVLGEMTGIPWMTRIRVWQGYLYLGVANSVVFVDVKTGKRMGSVACPVQNSGDSVRLSLIEDGKLYAATGNDDEGSLQVTAFSLVS